MGNNSSVQDVSFKSGVAVTTLKDVWFRSGAFLVAWGFGELSMNSVVPGKVRVLQSFFHMFQWSCITWYRFCLNWDPTRALVSVKVPQPLHICFVRWVCAGGRGRQRAQPQQQQQQQQWRRKMVVTHFGYVGSKKSLPTFKARSKFLLQGGPAASYFQTFLLCGWVFSKNFFVWLKLSLAVVVGCLLTLPCKFQDKTNSLSAGHWKARFSASPLWILCFIWISQRPEANRLDIWACSRKKNRMWDGSCNRTLWGEVSFNVKDFGFLLVRAWQFVQYFDKLSLRLFGDGVTPHHQTCQFLDTFNRLSCFSQRKFGALQNFRLWKFDRQQFTALWVKYTTENYMERNF